MGLNREMESVGSNAANKINKKRAKKCVCGGLLASKREQSQGSGDGQEVGSNGLNSVL